MENQVDFETLSLPNKNNFISDVICERKNHNDLVKFLAKHGINLENSLFCIEIKPFQCTFCEIRFGFSTNLECEQMEHFRENHLDKIIKVEPQIDIEDTISDHSMDSFPQEPQEVEPREKLNIEKPSSLKNKYQCAVCSASYDSLHTLNNHMNKHEERQFKCADCSLEFKKKGALVQHQAIHKPPEFECDEDKCNIKFTWYKGLAKHKLDIHGIKMNGKRNYTKMKNQRAQQFEKNNSTIELKQEIPINDEAPDESLRTTEFVNVGLKQEPNLPNEDEQGFLYPDCFPTSTDEGLDEKTMYKSQLIKCFECDKIFCNKMERFKHRTDFHGVTEDEEYIKCCNNFFEKSSNLYNEHLNLLHEPKKNSSAYECNLCDKSFKSLQHLEDHLDVHNESKLNCVPRNLKYHSQNSHKYACSNLTECKICGFNLKTDEELKKHMNSIHNNEVFICDYCGRTFENKTGLISHVVSMHLRNKPYKCGICFISLRSSQYLSYHMTRYHGADTKNEFFTNENIQIQCSICNERFANEEFLRAHQEKQASFKCDECNLVFCNPKSFFVHKSEVHNILKDKYYTKCHICSRYVSNSSIASHNRSYHKDKKSKTESDEQKKYECDHCGKQLSTESYLNSHLKVHGEPKYECTSCGKKFFIERSFVDHIRVNHKDTSLPCNICGKVFQSQRRLGIHIQKHEDRLSTLCTICNKDFKTRIAIKEHMDTVHKNLKKDLLKSHMNIKEFECDVCQKRFQTKNNLNNHKKIHNDERSYVCNECGKAFKQYMSLFLHKRIHTGIKPHKCTICDKSFYQPNRLKIHMTSHTGERNYHCIPCNVSYMGPTGIKRHNKSHHNINKAKIPYNSLQPEDVDKNLENEQQN